MNGLVWCTQANYLLAKNWTVLFCVGILCSECVTSMGRTVWCFPIVIVFLFLFSEVFEKGVILVYMAFIKVFFVLKFRYCTSLLNSCVVLSSNIAIFLLCCLCYHLHVICSQYVSLLCCMPHSCLLNWIWDDCLVVEHITGGGSVYSLVCNYNNSETHCLFGFIAVNVWVELLFLNTAFMSAPLKV